jgi:hypothetical protein
MLQWPKLADISTVRCSSLHGTPDDCVREHGQYGDATRDSHRWPCFYNFAADFWPEREHENGSLNLEILSKRSTILRFSSVLSNEADSHSQKPCGRYFRTENAASSNLTYRFSDHLVGSHFRGSHSQTMRKHGRTYSLQKISKSFILRDFSRAIYRSLTTQHELPQIPVLSPT